MKDIVLWFRAAFGDSRLYEFESVARGQLSRPIEWNWHTDIHHLDGGDIGPDLIQPLFGIEKVDIHKLANVAQRTMACKGVFSVLASGSNIEDCIRSLKRDTVHELSQTIDSAWCFRFAQLGRAERFRTEKRKEIVEAFGACLPILHQYPVDLHAAPHEFFYLEDYRREHGAPPLPKNALPTHVWLLYRHPPHPSVKHIRSLEDTLSLSKRAFISSTSLEASRSIQLLNMALNGNGRGKSILDPFCGSGSILLTASMFGARCVGADKKKYMLLPHKRVLQIPASKERKERGREKVSIYDNFSELDLPPPVILHSINIFQPDAVSIYLSANNHQQYDAIVTDPPYGIRASRIESEDDILQRLMDVSKQLLRTEGKLIFLFPMKEPKRHVLFSNQKCLQLISMGWERFSNDSYRMVVVMKKTNASRQD